MKSPANRLGTFLTCVATAMLVAGALNSAAANAAPFVYRVPILGTWASSTSPSQQAGAEILVALTGGPTLPAGEVNWPYNYDLNQLLSVSGDSSYDSSKVSWELQSGQLPAGLSLGSNGVISGIPTTKDTVGSSFQVLATYKTKTGQQAYTIVVNGSVLHVTQISPGGNHTCAVTTSGEAMCWGYNADGQLGNNSTTDSRVPVAVSGLTTGVANISAGTSHSCALTTSGGLMCWGYNGYGELGNNSTTNSSVPVAVSGLAAGVASISAGSSSTCAVTTSGGAKCWGLNSWMGLLGNNSTTNSGVPVDVSGQTSGVASISTGGNHACVVTTSGGAWCWGSNSNGQLGNGSPSSASSVPVAVLGLTSGVASISAGGSQTCAVTTSGGVKCWGNNSRGELGNNSTTASRVPVDVEGLASGIASISAGGNHTCAVSTSGAAKCWGGNSTGQLGNNSASNSSVPVAVAGLPAGVTSIMADNFHTCAITSSGAKCWGGNSRGQLGNNSLTSLSRVPVDVSR